MEVKDGSRITKSHKIWRELYNENNSKETKIIQITEFYKLLFVSLEIWDNITMEKKQVIGIFWEWEGDSKN